MFELKVLDTSRYEQWMSEFAIDVYRRFAPMGYHENTLPLTVDNFVYMSVFGSSGTPYSNEEALDVQLLFVLFMMRRYGVPTQTIEYLLEHYGRIQDYYNEQRFAQPDWFSLSFLEDQLNLNTLCDDLRLMAYQADSNLTRIDPDTGVDEMAPLFDEMIDMPLDQWLDEYFFLLDMNTCFENAVEFSAELVGYLTVNRLTLLVIESGDAASEYDEDEYKEVAIAYSKSRINLKPDRFHYHDPEYINPIRGGGFSCTRYKS